MRRVVPPAAPGEGVRADRWWCGERGGVVSGDLRCISGLLREAALPAPPAPATDERLPASELPISTFTPSSVARSSLLWSLISWSAFTGFPPPPSRFHAAMVSKGCTSKLADGRRSAQDRDR